ncbi:hypothetical protein [Acidovorax sp. MR-S7]|uniref:hypothetical protein n=1 Tax=Acidovorax sp. MR-S7 TaxID=1268622 RepID=UPI0009E58D42|nr:hypothetical protein [Acidovorax sp. MR-S7]
MKTPEPSKENPSAPNSAQFKGTSNPRHLRFLTSLLHGSRSREEADQIAGCSNSPQLVRSLRKLGLELPCRRLRRIDRDGKKCAPGIYSLTNADRQKVLAFFAKSSPAKDARHDD